MLEAASAESSGVSLVSDFTRGEILKISRGIAMILIVVYALASTGCPFF